MYFYFNFTYLAGPGYRFALPCIPDLIQDFLLCIGRLDINLRNLFYKHVGKKILSVKLHT